MPAFPTSDMPPFAFRHRWTAEALHRFGVPARWRRGSTAPESPAGPDEHAVLHWSLLQPECQHLQPFIASWPRHMAWLLGAILILALLSGVAGAWGVLGDGSRPVNVLWAVLLLLGMPTASLLLMLGLAGGRAGRSVSFGEIVWQIGRRLARGREASAVAEALGRLLTSGGALRPGLQGISHAIWLLALLGALIGLLAAFSLRSYQFVWQTTVLPDQVFVMLVQLLGAPGRWLGFAQPDPVAIAASVGEGLAAPDVRRAWAAWLIGVLCAWGMLPRVVFGFASAWMLRRRLRRTRLDLQQPFFQQLLAQRASLLARLEAPTGSVAVPVHRLSQYSGPALGGRVVALELGQPETAGQDWRDLVVHQVDDRADREAELDALGAQPVRRLLILLDARHSPDRSVGAWMAEASRHAAQTAVCLLAWAQTDAERQSVWEGYLAEFGFDQGNKFDHPGPAIDWLEERTA